MWSKVTVFWNIDRTVKFTWGGGRALRPHVLHLRPPSCHVSTHGHPTDIVFLDLQNSIVLEFYGALRTTENGKCPTKAIYFKIVYWKHFFFLYYAKFLPWRKIYAKKRTKYEPALRILHFFTKKVLKSLIKVTSMKSFKFY